MTYARSPAWFSGIDLILESFIIITAFMIATYSYNIFTILKSRKHKYFSIAFFLIGFAYFFRIISDILIYPTVHLNIESLLLTNFSINLPSEIIHFFSFFIFKLLVTLGFYILFLIATDTLKQSLIIVGSYLIFLSITFSSLFGTTIYHTVLIACLFFICWYYYNNMARLKSRSSYLIFLAFMFIFTAHIVFIIDYRIFYVLGELILIAGFVILLYNQIELKSKK